jgi:hypothetical protein
LFAEDVIRNSGNDAEGAFLKGVDSRGDDAGGGGKGAGGRRVTVLTKDGVAKVGEWRFGRLKRHRWSCVSTFDKLTSWFVFFVLKVASKKLFFSKIRL